jgi:hypothetical protein
MKLPRRKFLHLAAGATALPAVSRTPRAQAYRRVSIVHCSGAWCLSGHTSILWRTVMIRSTIGGTALVATLWVSPLAAQVFDLGKYPDLKGQWTRAIVPGAVGQPPHDPSKPFGRGQPHHLRSPGERRRRFWPPAAGEARRARACPLLAAEGAGAQADQFQEYPDAADVRRSLLRRADRTRSERRVMGCRAEPLAHVGFTSISGLPG